MLANHVPENDKGGEISENRLFFELKKIMKLKIPSEIQPPLIQTPGLTITAQIVNKKFYEHNPNFDEDSYFIPNLPF